MLRDRVIGERIKSTGANVVLELIVPGSGIKLQEPAPEFGELRPGEGFDLMLQLLDFAHESI